MPAFGFVPEDRDRCESASWPGRRRRCRHNAADKPTRLRVDDVDFITLGRAQVQHQAARLDVYGQDLGVARQEKGLAGIAAGRTRQVTGKLHRDAND